MNSEDDHQFRLAEYQSLREEILHRMSMRGQTIGFTLLAAGAMIGAGVQVPQGASLLLLYPILALFLALGWLGITRRVYRVARYIREQIEPQYRGGWETWLAANQGRLPFFGLETIPPAGLFLGTQVLAIVLAVVLTDGDVITAPTSLEMILLLVDGACLTLSSVFLGYHSIGRR